MSTVLYSFYVAFVYYEDVATTIKDGKLFVRDTEGSMDMLFVHPAFRHRLPQRSDYAKIAPDLTINDKLLAVKREVLAGHEGLECAIVVDEVTSGVVLYVEYFHLLFHCFSVCVYYSKK